MRPSLLPVVFCALALGAACSKKRDGAAASDKVQAVVGATVAPVETQRFVETVDAVGAVTVRMYSLCGQLVLEKSTNGGGQILLDRENLNNGIYFYEVTAEGRRIHKGKAVIY